MSLEFVLTRTDRVSRRRAEWEPVRLTLLEPILNPLWVYCLWGEPVQLSTWIGGGLIIGGLAVRTLLLTRIERRLARLEPQ